jgi:hypothetical protein
MTDPDRAGPPAPDDYGRSETLPRMSDADALRFVESARGCVVTWSRSDGHPVGAWGCHAVVDGAIYFSSLEDKAKNRAWQRDPRTTMIVEGPSGTVALYGRMERLAADDGRRERIINQIVDKMLAQAEAGQRAQITAPEDYRALVNTPRRELFHLQIATTQSILMQDPRIDEHQVHDHLNSTP